MTAESAYPAPASADFHAAVRHRRTIYGISGESTVSDERIREIIYHAVKHTPSAFNSQTTRLVVLLKQHHHKLWDITTETLRKLINSDEKFTSTAEKMASFRNGYGTVLFFEDLAVVRRLQEQFEAYADRFPGWSQHTSGMHQFVVWTALELEGLGASLQHYNPLIDDEVKREWNLPNSWDLIAQMPFGKPTQAPGDKEMQPVEERVRWFS